MSTSAATRPRLVRNFYTKRKASETRLRAERRLGESLRDLTRADHVRGN